MTQPNHLAIMQSMLARPANEREARPYGYLLAKLGMVMPLFQEARDALPAINEERRRLRGISSTLADRMDAAGTYSSADWHAQQHPVAAPEQGAEIDRLRAALLDCARQAEALKRECGMDPESQQAVRNAQYQAISTTAHIALGTILGPEGALARKAGA